nr:hemagglutinin repeat-containing protein [Aeromonas jandaei]
MSVFANLNAAKGKELGNSGRYTETTLTAGDTLTLTSGRDATLLGAQVRRNLDTHLFDRGVVLLLT